jgi:hypothetical protein
MTKHSIKFPDSKFIVSLTLLINHAILGTLVLANNEKKILIYTLEDNRLA